MLLLRELGKTVDAAVFSDPVAGLDMIRMCMLGIAGRSRLFRCEKALLAIRDFVELPKGFFRGFFHIHNTTNYLRYCVPQIWAEINTFRAQKSWDTFWDTLY